MFSGLLWRISGSRRDEEKRSAAIDAFDRVSTEVGNSPKNGRLEGFSGGGSLPAHARRSIIGKFLTRLRIILDTHDMDLPHQIHLAMKWDSSNRFPRSVSVSTP
jgi:hypothetical protein